MMRVVSGLMNTPVKTINTISDLIDAFGGSTRFAAVIGKNPSTASEMKRRGSIPVEYWPKVIDGARDAGIHGISNDTLVQLHIAPSALTAPAAEAAA